MPLQGNSKMTCLNKLPQYKPCAETGNWILNKMFNIKIYNYETIS